MTRKRFQRTAQGAASALMGAIWSLSAAAVPPQGADGVEQAHLVETRALHGALHHVQGLALDGTHMFITSVDGAARRGFLHEFDRANGREIRRIELTDGARYHPGGLSIIGRSIWVPVAELHADSSAVLVEIDADTLAVRRRIAVPDHLGCVAASPRALVAANWDARLFYVFDRVSGRLVRTVPNPSGTAYQDIKFVGDHLVAGGTRGPLAGSLDWLSWPALRVGRSLHAGLQGQIRPFGRGGPYTGEGMAIDGRDLYLLPEDGPSHLFRFRLDV